MSILIEENMNKPKKSIRVFLIIGLIALNIVMFVMVLQRTLPGESPRGEECGAQRGFVHAR